MVFSQEVWVDGDRSARVQRVHRNREADLTVRNPARQRGGSRIDLQQLSILAGKMANVHRWRGWSAHGDAKRLSDDHSPRTKIATPATVIAASSAASAGSRPRVSRFRVTAGGGADRFAAAEHLHFVADEYHFVDRSYLASLKGLRVESEL
jgi:hypothetical protein